MSQPIPNSTLNGLCRQPHIRDLQPFTAKGRRRMRKYLGLAPNAVIHKRSQIAEAKEAAAVLGYTKPKPRKGPAPVARTVYTARKAWKR